MQVSQIHRTALVVLIEQVDSCPPLRRPLGYQKWPW